MYKAIKKIPAGMLLIPMLISALINTFAPGLFHIGGVSEAFFTSAGTSYIIGAICFCSGAGIDIKEIIPIIKKIRHFNVSENNFMCQYRSIIYSFFWFIRYWGY